MNTETHNSPTALNRRSLAKGAAWAAPVVAASAAVPAYAASPVCNPVTQVQQRIFYDYGTISGFGGTSNPRLEITDTLAQITYLPRGVYLTKFVEIVWWEQRDSARTRGVWPMNDSRATIAYNANCTNDTCGWSDLTFYQKDVTKTSRTGVRRKMWSAALSWTAVGNSSAPVNFSYSGPTSSGCYQMRTREADQLTAATAPNATGYLVNYNNMPNVYGLAGANSPNAQHEYHQWEWYFLSNGQVIAKSNNPNDPAPALPPISPLPN